MPKRHRQLPYLQCSFKNCHKQAIFRQNDKNEKDAQKEQHTSNKAPRIDEEAIDSLNAKVKKINDDIFAIEVPNLEDTQHPDTHQFTNLQQLKQTRLPHCKTCGHPVKGHQVLNGMKRCPHCQNQMCAVSSKEKGCLCEWHLKSNCREVKRMDYDIETIEHKTTVECLFPIEMCQYRLSDSGITSNACTDSSILAGLKFLQGELDIPIGKN